MQAPAIYRLFGDKGGLLDAVVEHGYASYVASKPPVDADADPVEGLRAGWECHVGFGLSSPVLFRLMHTVLRSAWATLPERGPTSRGQSLFPNEPW